MTHQNVFGIIPVDVPAATVPASAERSWIPEVLDHLPIGVILTDAQCRVLHYNSSAREILTQNDGLTLRGDTLMTTGGEQMLALRSVVLRAMNADPAAQRHSLVVARRSARPAYEVVVSCVQRTHGTHVAAIFICDPAMQPVVMPQVVCELYGLTQSEAKLAEQLAQGRTISEAAELLGIARETARKRLRAIFSKTGANRQSELVRMLVAGPACLRLTGAAGPNESLSSRGLI